ncbi:TIGR01777 family oxidoreductase [Hymenobacter sp. BT175]|uniref:TIGR01777 family oxidoreductase n=1 Tax=Hymenobacter translucens TaxID=2886507 RepID=UPI001D0DF0C6|nr:TIGR01777 family oxidoreductase [Hymenobacter translucens]MCC2546893.1 TIGR01777 family oxidoreductase [Hymenobacter translucens]
MTSLPTTAPRLVITGGNGFLGRHLNRHFTSLGYRVTVLSRTPRPAQGEVAWDARTLGAWVTELEGAAILINMAGRTVDCRYTARNRAEILASRVDSTRILGEAVASCRNPPAVWLNSSTATIYADTPGTAPANTEATGVIGEGFSVDVATAWEAAFTAVPTPRTRRVALRTSIVLGTDGGAFPVMARLARLGLCTPQGTGRQWVSWLHIEDFCRAVEFLATQTTEDGPFNVCAPVPLPNQEFNALLARHYRPWLRLPQPEWLLTLGAVLLRTETELILKSRKVVPRRLLDLGFAFRYPTCAQAVAALT